MSYLIITPLYPNKNTQNFCVYRKIPSSNWCDLYCTKTCFLTSTYIISNFLSVLKCPVYLSFLAHFLLFVAQFIFLFYKAFPVFIDFPTFQISASKFQIFKFHETVITHNQNFNRHFTKNKLFLEQFQVHSKIEWQVQIYLIYHPTTHIHSLPSINIPHQSGILI